MAWDGFERGMVGLQVIPPGYYWRIILQSKSNLLRIDNFQAAPDEA